MIVVQGSIECRALASFVFRHTWVALGVQRGRCVVQGVDVQASAMTAGILTQRSPFRYRESYTESRLLDCRQ